MVYRKTKPNNGIQVWTHPSTDKKDNSTSSVYHLQKAIYTCSKSKRDHSYYHQVQLQLYVTRFMAHWCDFCVYTSKGVVVERILPDKQWQEECIPKLDKYFFDHILPELIDPQCKPSFYL